MNPLRATAVTGPSPDLLRADAALAEAVRALTAAGVPSPRRDGLLLLAHVLGAGAGEAERLVVLRRDLPPGDADRFAALVAERARRVPLQHLTGTAAFRRLTLRVGPGVFVPRPETESVAGAVIDLLSAAAAGTRRRVPVVADLCTGSGAIALAVATEVPCARVIAVDSSPEALAWAQLNVAALCPRVELRAGDVRDEGIADDLAGAVDIVVANPPYVPPGQVPADPEVREHDPALALFGGGPDGLEVPRAVVLRAEDMLAAGGWLVMEHADVQGGTLVSWLRSRPGWTDVSGHHDDTGRPRFVRARWRTPRQAGAGT